MSKFDLVSNILLVIALYLSTRNMLVYRWRNKANKAISAYYSEKIREAPEGDLFHLVRLTDEFISIMCSYNYCMYAFWEWGEMSVIKPEYREKIKEYYYED